MAFQLYRLKKGTYVKTEFRDLDDKAFWCDLGNKKEQAFVKLSEDYPFGYKIAIHPNKENDPYFPDLLVNGNEIGEVKIKNSPLFIARDYGVNPQFALTMDLKDSFNYCKWLEKGVDIKIFIWVKWEAHRMVRYGRTYEVNPMKGVWMTHFSKLRKKELSSDPPGIHWYKESFRQPTKHSGDAWAAELGIFEPRLELAPGIGKSAESKNITSNGFVESNGVKYPSGQSSGAYVFDLSDSSLFEELIYK